MKVKNKIIKMPWKVNVLVAQSCPTLCDPMDYNPPGFSIHGILQARTLEIQARTQKIPLSRGSSGPKDQTMSLALPTDS